ncbi:hypothetical protein Tco_0925987 [Tanacetum coccineum]|uniref:Phospholipase-like protein n=1 Tax=Tanacetum coccineum TaxID=301880 RepID=A0ABQ5DAG4_9ASTR
MNSSSGRVVRFFDSSIADDVFLRMVEDLEDWNDFLGENYVAGVLLLAIMNVSTQTHKLSANNALGKLTPTLFPHIPCLDLYCVSRVIKSDGSLVTKISKAIPWRMFLAPLVEYGGLFGDYLKKLSLAHTRRVKDKEPFIQSCPKIVSLKDRVKALEGLCDSLMILPKEIKSLKARIYKLETIINHKDSTSGKQCDLGDKYWSDQDGEPFFKYMGSTNPSANKDVVNDLVDALDDLVDENGVVEVDKNLSQDDFLKAQKLEAEKNRVAEQKRLRLQLMLEEANSRKSIDFSKSTHMKVAIERCGTNKRRYVDVLRPPIEEDTSEKVLSIDRLKKQNNVLDEFMIQMCLNLKPWKEDLKRPSKCIDKIYCNYYLEQFLITSSWSHCKFPWCTEIVVGRHFWDSLIGLDDESLGWLVDDVFILINEPKRHWSLAQFHIQYGNVTFYDSQKTYDLEFRPWVVYLVIVACLSAYFFTRLAHGIPLDVEDPIQTALAYREKLVQLVCM